MQRAVDRIPVAERSEHRCKPLLAAHSNGLRYVNCDESGITRVRRRGGFVYLRANGSQLKDPRELARIRALVIPPAWTNVWICTNQNGHIQATGFDQRGRKQYRYHARWRSVRDEAKFQDIVEFARRLPALRATLARDMAQRELNKTKVVATVVRILEQTCIRVGNQRYAEQNRSYGLTTLLDQHARVRGESVEFSFRAKSGKACRRSLRDRRLAAIVKRCRDIPGQRLFQYFDKKGRHYPVTSHDVNDYIRRAMGHGFTAKNFRTWAGSLGAALLLREQPFPESARQAHRTEVQVIAAVASELGNTPAVCRKSYVHPGLLEAYREGSLHQHFRVHPARTRAGLSPPETALLAFFERRSPTVRQAA
jgi:DNA topoisomerase-1